MSRKETKIPDGDVTARKRTSATDDPGTDIEAIPNLQTSNKSGKHSSVEKIAASRPEFAESPGAHPKDGAFGAGNPGSEGLNGRPGEVSRKVRSTKGASKE
jgi:hypothetical protein